MLAAQSRGDSVRPEKLTESLQFTTPRIRFDEGGVFLRASCKLGFSVVLGDRHTIRVAFGLLAAVTAMMSHAMVSAQQPDAGPWGLGLHRLPPVRSEVRRASFVEPVPSDSTVAQLLEPPPPQPDGVDETLPMEVDVAIDQSSAAIDAPFEGTNTYDRVGTNFYTSNAGFNEGIIIVGRGAVMKISGYVKVDLIQDFNPIDSTDLFDTTTIPVGDPPRQNARFHARQSRLNFDTRWMTDRGPVRVFVEGDFFSDEDRIRMRHAYAEVGPWIFGQTWTTFTDMLALPNTLDNEGSVSSVSRRQAQVRLDTANFLRGTVGGNCPEKPRDHH